MTPGQAFGLVTWAILWWHLARWLVRVVMVALLVGMVKPKKGVSDPGK